MSSRTGLKAPLRRNVELSRYTTMHAGGPAHFLAEPHSEEELIELIEYARQEEMPYLILGRGSNVIFSERGYPGLVLVMNHYGSERIDFDSDRPIVTASAGVQLYKFCLACKDQGLGGSEFLCSIPGSIGGALVMNAGFSRHAGQLNAIGDLVESVTILDGNGQKQVLTKAQLEFSYRHSNLKGRIVLSGTFHLWRRAPEVIEQEIRANFDYRGHVQDVKYPSSGSIFKNPHEGPSAGRLIDSLGLKGLRVGDAMISHEHANYMINAGQAKGSDFVELIEKVQKAVFDATGVLLEREVIVI